jgi:hypothetical protein
VHHKLTFMPRRSHNRDDSGLKSGAGCGRTTDTQVLPSEGSSGIK